MAGGIPLDWLINVTSTGVRDIFSLAKLHTLLITQGDSANPRPQFERFYNANSVLKAYGADSSVYKFAVNYFGFTSKTATKADLLTVYRWNKTATGAILQGAKVDKSVGYLSALNGVLSVSIGGIVENVAVNFEGATSLSDIAQIMQTAINAVGVEVDDSDPENPVTTITNPGFANASVFYNANTQGFILVSGETGENSSVDYVSGDFADDLGLTAQSGAVIIAGSEAAETISEALAEIEAENGAYYNISTDFAFDNEMSALLEVAKFTNQSNSRYLFTYISDNKALINNADFTGNLKGYDGLNIEYRISEEQDGYSSGIISAINFARTNGNYNVAFNSGNAFNETAISKVDELETLEANLANSFLKFGKLGQFNTWYGMGNVCGQLTNSLNVYVANSFLVFSEQFALANMFNSQPMVGLRGTNNNALVMSYLESVFLEAVNSAIAIRGAELTTTEKNAVLTAFGEDGETAITQLQDNGYFYKIDSVDLVTKTINIVQAYVANTPIKRVVIANYILGA